MSLPLLRTSVKNTKVTKAESVEEIYGGDKNHCAYNPESERHLSENDSVIRFLSDVNCIQLNDLVLLHLILSVLIDILTGLMLIHVPSLLAGTVAARAPDAASTTVWPQVAVTTAACAS